MVCNSKNRYPSHLNLLSQVCQLGHVLLGLLPDIPDEPSGASLQLANALFIQCNIHTCTWSVYNKVVKPCKNPHTVPRRAAGSSSSALRSPARGMQTFAVAACALLRAAPTAAAGTCDSI